MVATLLFSLFFGIAAFAAPAPENRAGVRPRIVQTRALGTVEVIKLLSMPTRYVLTYHYLPSAACRALPGFIPYASGGDGNGTPRFFVGYWPSDDTAVVAHQGTDPSKLLSLLTDVDCFPVSLDSKLFPGMGGALVHNGFSDSQRSTSSAVLAAVKRIMVKETDKKCQSERGVKKVTTIGHSLGGAIALLDGVFLKLQLPAGTQIKIVTHGMPRVGNQWFADWVDSNISDLSRINN
ncbi:hypothetical protein BOTBODRAFT_143019, partial [Botryobasidium botryosum FD-172 SS1]